MRGRKASSVKMKPAPLLSGKKTGSFPVKETITKTVAAALLKEGRVSMSGLFSEKTGKTYDAVVVLDDTGEKYVNFKLEFPQQRGRKK